MARSLLDLAFKSRVLYRVVMVKHIESNSTGTLFFFITSEPIPIERSAMSSILIYLGFYSIMPGGSVTQRICFSSLDKYSFLWTNLLVFLQNFINMSPLINYLVNFKAYVKLGSDKSLSLT